MRWHTSKTRGTRLLPSPMSSLACSPRDTLVSDYDEFHGGFGLSSGLLLLQVPTCNTEHPTTHRPSTPKPTHPLTHPSTHSHHQLTPFFHHRYPSTIFSPTSLICVFFVSHAYLSHVSLIKLIWAYKTNMLSGVLFFFVAMTGASSMVALFIGAMCTSCCTHEM